MGATLCDSNSFCDGQTSSCPTTPAQLVYLDKTRVAMTTYLSDTVTQCSAKVASISSSQLMAMCSYMSSNLMVVAAGVGAIAFAAFVLAAKKPKHSVSMEDGYTCLVGKLAK
ncbi:hypothetical protein ACHHYP_20792 [Achlya hypogyna]|uniref:Uncharacterized protein n=1 Tax=Achlya hypogyna TaxID=1202772 RepID=A0A1V9Y9S5_ACHHY|nr:hypothetical protein ACHHYP_20792 [Achlya hypogyna]